jgi:hypothetical protein
MKAIDTKETPTVRTTVTALKSVKRPMTPGQIAAAKVAAEAEAKRAGTQPEPAAPPPDDELKEDWQEDATLPKPTADQALAGLYRVTHGNLWIGPNRIARGPRLVDGIKQPGRKVRLSAEDANMFLEQGLVERMD